MNLEEATDSIRQTTPAFFLPEQLNAMELNTGWYFIAREDRYIDGNYSRLAVHAGKELHFYLVEYSKRAGTLQVVQDLGIFSDDQSLERAEDLVALHKHSEGGSRAGIGAPMHFATLAGMCSLDWETFKERFRKWCSYEGIELEQLRPGRLIEDEIEDLGLVGKFIYLSRDMDQRP